MRGRLAFVLIVAAATVLAIPVGAQPTPTPPTPPPDEEIEMEPEPAGSGSAPGSAGSAVEPPKPPPPPDPPAPDPDEPPPIVKDPKLAKKVHAAAVQLAQKGDYYTRAKKPDDAKSHYEQAATAFQKAIETGDDLNYYLDLATVEDKLGKHDLAAVHIRIIIKAQPGAVRPDVLKKATAKLDELLTKVGLVTLTVNPEATHIKIGGTEVGISPLADPLILMPGTHMLTFSSDGYQPKEIEIKVEAGSESERTIELEAVKIIVEPVKPVTGPVDEPVDTPPSKLPMYIGAGATAALFGTAVVTGILALSQHGTYTADDSSKGERDVAKSNGETLALVTDLCLLGTVAAAGFTTWYYLYRYKNPPAKKAAPMERKPAFDPDATSSIARPDRSRSTAKVDVIPWVQPDAAGLTVGGSF